MLIINIYLLFKLDFIHYINYKFLFCILPYLFISKYKTNIFLFIYNDHSIMQILYFILHYLLPFLLYI